MSETSPTGRKPRDVRDFIRMYSGSPSKLGTVYQDHKKLLELDFGEMEARVVAWHKEMRR